MSSAAMASLFGDPGLLAMLLLVSGAMAAVMLFVVARILGLPLDTLGWLLRRRTEAARPAGARRWRESLLALGGRLAPPAGVAPGPARTREPLG